MASGHSFVFYSCEIRLMRSKRGRPILQAGKYRFNQHGRYRNGGPKILWLCIRWGVGCRASITTYENEIVKLNIKRNGRRHALYPTKTCSVATNLSSNIFKSHCSTLPCGMQYLQAQIPRKQIRHRKKEVLSRYTHYLKPDVNAANTLPIKHLKKSTKSVKCKTNRCRRKLLKNVGSVSAVPPKDIFDSDLSACSFDVQDVESGIPEATNENVPASSSITSSNFNPILTLCKLPAVLITSNVKLVSSNQSIASQNSESTKYLQFQVLQGKTDDLKTAEMQLRTQYKKTDNGVSPIQITNNLNHSMDNKCSTSQYPESLQYMQVEVPQIETCDTEDTARLTQYTKQDVSDAPIVNSNSLTLPMENRCSTTQYAKNMQYVQVQLPQGETYELPIEEVSSHTQYLKTEDGDATELVSNGLTLPIENQSNSTQYPGGVQFLQVLPQGESCVLKTEDTSSHTQYQETDSNGATNLITSNFDFPMETQCRTSQYPKSMQYLQVEVAQAELRDVKIEDTSDNIQYIKPDVDEAPTLDSNLGLPIETQCSTSQYPESMRYLRVQVSQNEPCELKIENSPHHTQYQKTEDVVASSLNNDNLSLPMEIQSSTSQYLESIRYLQVQVPQAETCSIKTEDTADTQYQQTDGSVTQTNGSLSLPMDTSINETLHGTQFEKKDNTVPPVLQSNIFDSDLSTFSLDAVLNAETSVTQQDMQSAVIPVSTTQTSDNLHTVLSDCDFPVGLITSSVNLISNNECSSTHYGLQDLQEEVAQREGYILTSEASQCDLQYMDTAVSYAPTLTSASTEIATEIQTMCESSNLSQTWTSQEIPETSSQISTKPKIVFTASQSPSKSQVQSITIVPDTACGSSKLPETQTSQEIPIASDQISNMPKATFTVSRPIIKIQLQTPTIGPENAHETANLVQTQTSQEISSDQITTKDKTNFITTLSPCKSQLQIPIIISEPVRGLQNLPQAQTPQEISNASEQITNMPKTVFTTCRPMFKIQLQTPTIVGAATVPDQTISKPKTSLSSSCPISKGQLTSPTVIRDQTSSKPKSSLTAPRPASKSQVQTPKIIRETGCGSTDLTKTFKAKAIPDPPNLINNKPKTPRRPRKSRVQTPTVIPDLDFRFLVSPRGKRSLLVNDIIYRMTSSSLGKTRWRCSTHERFGCKAVAHTIDSKIVYITNDHITSTVKALDKSNPTV